MGGSYSKDDPVNLSHIRLNDDLCQDTSRNRFK